MQTPEQKRAANRLACRKYAVTEKGRQAKRASYRRNAHKNSLYVARSTAKHPERQAARMELHNAIRRGEITRQGCEVCGGRAEGHHADYAKPLSVRWLCTHHHKLLHRKEE